MFTYLTNNSRKTTLEQQPKKTPNIAKAALVFITQLFFIQVLFRIFVDLGLFRLSRVFFFSQLLNFIKSKLKGIQSFIWDWFWNFWCTLNFSF